MRRNPFNTNQQLHSNPTFQGAPVITNHGPLIRNHLQKIHECFSQALEQHSRICLMRFDLYVPLHASNIAIRNNQLISKFLASLDAKLEHAQEQSRKAGRRVHGTNMRYLWCREISTNGRVHYHVAVLLNHAAYAFMGQFKLESSNMYSRIHEAWANALSMYVEDVKGEVHIPDHPTHQIIRGDESSLHDAFYRVSYFSKMVTKEYGQGFHTFGCSRK